MTSSAPSLKGWLPVWRGLEAMSPDFRLSGDLNTKSWIFKDAIPNLARVALLQSPGSVTADLTERARHAAVALKLKWRRSILSRRQRLESAFKPQSRSGHAFDGCTRPFFAERKRIVELAGKYACLRLLSEGVRRRSGLMSYGADFVISIGTRLLRGQDMKGAKPADLPVQQATKFEFVITVSGKKIGLTIPPRVLERANKGLK